MNDTEHHHEGQRMTASRSRTTRSRARARLVERTVWPGVVALATLAAPVFAQEYPSSFPATPMPDIKGCSGSRAEFLRKAWRHAHYYAWRADRVLQHIRKQNDTERRYLWDLDFQADADQSSSPRTFFGPYEAKRFDYVAEAVQKAVRRFEHRGRVVKGIRTLRCGQPLAPRQDEHTDVCPSTSTGGKGPPSAYHAPVGVIVTCPSFWHDAENQFRDFDDRLDDAARTLVHEIFHWLSVDGTYVTDLHGGKYRKGLDNAAYLAREHQGWAIRNNDNYAFFARNVGRAEAFYSAVWSPKRADTGATGGFFVDLSWDDLVKWWKELSGEQYLASVCTYVKGGERRYTAVWRVGPRSGALYGGLSWKDFAEKFNELKETQDLIDVEVYKVGDDFEYLGVWRRKRPGAKGVGGLLNLAGWDDLVAKWQRFADGAYLCDVETYVQDGTRRYVGVWRPGRDNGALLQTSDWDAFSDYKQSQNGAQDLLDFERFLDGGGRWRFMGVWRAGRPSGVLLRRLSGADLVDSWKKYEGEYELTDVEVFAPLPTRIR